MLDKVGEGGGIHSGDGRVSPRKHRSPQTLQRGAREGRTEGSEFVDEAAEGPDVGLAVVRLVRPDLGGHVVRRANLGLHLVPSFQPLRDIQVTESNRAVFGQKAIRSLDVSVQDSMRMEEVDGF